MWQQQLMKLEEEESGSINDVGVKAANVTVEQHHH